MPSSNWRLIRTDGSPVPASHAPAASPPSRLSVGVPDDPTERPTNPFSAGTPRPASSLPGQTVFRGRGRAANHSAGPAQTLLALSGQGDAADTTEVDRAALAEELLRLERAAEERGYETGRRRAESELRAAVEGASAMADRLAQLVPDRTSEVAHAIAELALTVAKRVVQHEVRIEPSLLCASLEAAVSTINGSPEAHVLLNPNAVEPVREAWEALHGRAYLGKKWVFEGDPTLPDGGCTLRYDHGFVEAGLESQLEEIGIALDRAIPGLSRNEADEDVA